MALTKSRLKRIESDIKKEYRSVALCSENPDGTIDFEGQNYQSLEDLQSVNKSYLEKIKILFVLDI